jgi:hypothetical protein
LLCIRVPIALGHWPFRIKATSELLILGTVGKNFGPVIRQYQGRYLYRTPKTEEI